jgi:hypothetical protein
VNLLKNGIGVEQARALVIILKEHPTLKSLCGNNGDETELDMSGKMNGAEDAIMLAAEIIDNGAISSLNLAKNSLWAEGTKVLAEALKANQIMTELNLSGNDATFDGNEYAEMSGVIALAEVMPDMAALTKFDISNNLLYTAGAKALAKALSGNQIVTELNVAGNRLGEAPYRTPDTSGVVTLARTIKDMGALTSLSLSSNNLTTIELYNCKPVTIETSMTEADFSWNGNGFGVSGAILLSAFLPKCM